MGEWAMPEKATIEKARKAKREGKAPTTQAGEFVHEEIEIVRQGEHGARSPQQAIAIGLSMARRAGVDLPPPKKGKVKESTRKSADQAGQGERETKRRPRVSRAVSKVLEHERTASHEALSQHAKRAAAHRTAEERSAAAEKAAETKGSSQGRPRAKGGGAEGGKNAGAPDIAQAACLL
jgi:hypothetical protein